MKKFFIALCLTLAFVLGTLIGALGVVQNIEVYDIADNQLYLDIYGQVYAYDFTVQ